jgi:putative transposase
MKRSKFTEVQIAFILRQGEKGTAVGEICRKRPITLFFGSKAVSALSTAFCRSEEHRCSRQC